MIRGRREGIQQFTKSDKANVGVWTCRKTFDRYMENASLHGLRYIGDRKLTWFERCFFLVILFVVLTLSAYFMTNAWITWTSKTTVTMSSDTISITKLAFPGKSFKDTGFFVQFFNISYNN